MENVKLCTKCNLIKDFSQFGKFKLGKFGLNSHCKMCRKEYDFQNRDKFLKYHKNKREKELDKFMEYDKKYKSENKEKINQYNRKRWKEDIQHRIKGILRVRLHFILKENKKIESAYKLIGCEIPFFKKYIEDKFLPEFNWENHGFVWELDHIIPCSKFDFSKFEEQKRCFHYSNYQPLFKTTKIAKLYGYEDQIGNRNKSNK